MLQCSAKSFRAANKSSLSELAVPSLSLSQNMLPYVLLSPHSQFMPSSGQCFDVFHAVFPLVFHVRSEEPFRGNFGGTFRVLFPAAKDVLFALFRGAVALSKRVCVCVYVFEKIKLYRGCGKIARKCISKIKGLPRACGFA